MANDDIRLTLSMSVSESLTTQRTYLDVFVHVWKGQRSKSMIHLIEQEPIEMPDPAALKYVESFAYNAARAGTHFLEWVMSQGILNRTCSTRESLTEELTYKEWNTQP